MDTSNSRYALITGASSGIGLAFAEEFARNRFNLILVARRREKLRAIGSELQQKYRIQVVMICADLNKADALESIQQRIAECNLTIDALVNNAGFGTNRNFLEADWSEHNRSLTVMLTGYTRLCYLLAPSMKARGYGRIINVSSLAAFLPPTAGSLYTAIKSYVLHMSAALDLELRPFGIHCTAVCPGFTYSEFHDVMKVRQAVSKYPGFMWMDAERVAREGYKAVMKGKPVVINGIVNSLIAGVAAVIPRYLARRIQRLSHPWGRE